MADRIKDNEDRMLEALFSSDPLPDDGFSVKVMRRVNHRIWVRRLALPIAFVAGATVAVKPLSQLAITFSKLLMLIPANVGEFSPGYIPQASTLVFGGLLLAVILIIPKLLDF